MPCCNKFSFQNLQSVHTQKHVRINTLLHVLQKKAVDMENSSIAASGPRIRINDDCRQHSVFPMLDFIVSAFTLKCYQHWMGM